MEGKIAKQKKYYRSKYQQETDDRTKSEDAYDERSHNVILFTGNFEYNFLECVNHLLAKLLPDSRFRIRFKQKLIFGQEKSVHEIIRRLDDNLKQYSGFVIELFRKNDKQDIEYEIEDSFKAKIFGSNLIEKCIVDFFKGTKYEDDCTSFLKIFQCKESKRLFVRIKKQFKGQFLKKIEKKALFLDLLTSSNRQSNKQRRGNRQNLRKEIVSIQIEAQHFDSKGWKEFLSKNQKLDKRNIQILDIRNQEGIIQSFKVRLYCEEEQVPLKLQAFNYYFKHQNFIKLPIKQSKHKSSLIKKYYNFNKPWLKIKLIQGYKQPKWNDKTLLFKIRLHKYTNKKTNLNSEYFQAFHLIGLLPKVRQYIEELQFQINNVPLDQVRQSLFLNFDQDIGDALQNDQEIQQFIQNFIASYAEKFQDICQITDIQCSEKGAQLTLLITPGKEKDFQQSVKANLKIVMMKEIRIHKHETDFTIDRQFSQKLLEKGIKIINFENKSFKYIEANQNLTETVKKIQEITNDFQNVTQEYIQIQGKCKLQNYLDLIKTVKDNEQFKMIFVTEPQSKDKINFRIGFIGQRKKNELFTNLIKQKISQLQKDLESYYYAVDQQQANFLINDTHIQEHINKKFNIQMIVNASFTFEAKLSLLPLDYKKNIYFYKSKKLSIAPFGSTIYFTSMTQLQEFSQKYLDPLKIHLKTIKNQAIMDKQVNRQLRLYYKDQMALEELIQDALDVSQKKQKICFIMPYLDKQKFIQQILTILTNNPIYQQINYQIFIIQTDQEADIMKLVKIPQYSENMKKQLVTQWTCEGKPYSESGNNKINDAVARGLKKCLLDQDDLGNQYQKSEFHLCDFKRNIITYVLTQQQFPFTVNGDKINYNYNGYHFQFSNEQTNLVKFNRKNNKNIFYMSLTHFQIDLVNFNQINLFTETKRAIQKTEKTISHYQKYYNGKVLAYYNYLSPTVIYSFEESVSNKLLDALNEVNNYIQQNVINETIALKEVGTKYKSSLQQVIQVKAEENQLTYQYDSQKNIVVVHSLNQKNIERFKKIVQKQVDYLVNLQSIDNTKKHIQKPFQIYPPSWTPQTQQISIFDVLKMSDQFQNVQKLFTVLPIHSLQRIQNKYLYKRYKKQLDHLTFLNDNKIPKEMMLFHGTYQNNPQNIWGDKEEGFNINYSSDDNWLGMGIYFAEKSQYSLSYKYKETNSNINNLYSMFLCSVIVGDSQEMPMTIKNKDVKDTTVKNSKGLRYESMKGKHDISDIYTVYKNKRAYPSYLIKFIV